MRADPRRFCPHWSWDPAPPTDLNVKKRETEAWSGFTTLVTCLSFTKDVQATVYERV